MTHPFPTLRAQVAWAIAFLRCVGDGCQKIDVGSIKIAGERVCDHAISEVAMVLAAAHEGLLIKTRRDKPCQIFLNRRRLVAIAKCAMVFI